MSIGDCPNWPACGHKTMGQCDADILGNRPAMHALADKLQSTGHCFGDPIGTFADKRGTFADTTGCFKAPTKASVQEYQRPDYRKCEFCGCNTNAAARACCDKGREADKALNKNVCLKDYLNG